MDYNINFPNLHIYMDHVGKTIQIGSFSIAYYGIIIALGMVAGLVLACYQAKKTGQNPDTYFDLAIIAIITSLIGARIYYVAFRWDYYKDNLLSIFNLRQGGIAIYGAIIAAIITAYIFARVKKIPFFRIADTACLGLLLGQIIGRWGNFFNREVFGGYTDNLFAMQLPVSAVRASDITEELWAHTIELEGVTYIQVHPTFLYESVWNLILLILLLVFFKKRKFEGEVFLWYMFGYGVGRFWIEAIRTDQLLIPGIEVPVSMVVAAVIVIASLVLDIVMRVRMAKRKVTE